MADPGYTIRHYQPRDLEPVYAICLGTGDAGQDASQLYADPLLLGHLYVGPYVTLEPRSAFVLEDQTPCGYIVGAADSAAFQRALVEQWLPDLRARYPRPAGDPRSWTPTERLCHRLHVPPEPPAQVTERFPSHLHINLLPRAQGKGQGRRLMDRFLARLREGGSRGVHLGVDARNAAAMGFYRRLGFCELMRTDDGGAVYMGLRLRASGPGT